jgi:hypothetical protein
MKWLHFILSHSIFIAFCAVGISFQTILICPAKVDYWVLAFIFFSTLFSYNAYWLLSKKINLNDLLATQKKEVLLILASVFVAIGSLLKSSLNVKIILLAVVLNALYMLPLLPFNQLSFTKKIGFLKTVVLAFTWTYVTIILPLNKPLFYLDNEKLLLFSYRFLFMLLLCIMFDTRDIAIDKIKGLHSIATDSKPIQLKILVATLFALMAYVVFLMHSLGLNNGKTISLIISLFAVLYFYFKSLKKQGYFFYYFYVDGLMLFSALVTYVASI